MRRAILLVLLLPILARAQSTPRVQLGLSVSRDTVTVGQVFEVRVRVRAPADAAIRFPEPDSLGAVQARDPVLVQVTDSVAALDETAVYRMAAWDIGAQPIVLGDVVVTWQGSDRPVAVGRASVFVKSVLPADSALRVPKPARPLWEPAPFPWWLVAALVAAALIGLFIWWWRRRRNRPKPRIVVDPFVRAQKEFTRIEAMRLLEADERTRFIALNVEVLRDYLAARYPDASLALTSRELVALLRKSPSVPLELLSRVLHEADLAKFAAWTLSEERARALARDARDIVGQEHEASRPKPQAPTTPTPPARAAA